MYADFDRTPDSLTPNAATIPAAPEEPAIKYRIAYIQSRTVPIAAWLSREGPATRLLKTIGAMNGFMPILALRLDHCELRNAETIVPKLG